MPRTKKQTKHKKLTKNNDDQFINNVIDKLKYTIITYRMEHKEEQKTILKYEIYTLKISFIVNTDEPLILITIIIKNGIDDTADIMDKVVPRINNYNNIQCDICFNEFIICKHSKTRFICSQCNIVYCFNCFKNLVNYGKGVIKCPNCRIITDTPLRDSKHLKMLLYMQEKEYC